MNRGFLPDKKVAANDMQSATMMVFQIGLEPIPFQLTETCETEEAYHFLCHGARFRNLVLYWNDHGESKSSPLENIILDKSILIWYDVIVRTGLCLDIGLPGRFRQGSLEAHYVLVKLWASKYPVPAV